MTGLRGPSTQGGKELRGHRRREPPGGQHIGNRGLRRDVRGLKEKKEDVGVDAVKSEDAKVETVKSEDEVSIQAQTPEGGLQEVVKVKYPYGAKKAPKHPDTGEPLNNGDKVILKAKAGVDIDGIFHIPTSKDEEVGAVPTESYLEVGRNELVDARSEERTIEKTQRVLEKARGGVLFVDEIYNLLPSHGRQGSQDHGPAALKVLATGLTAGDPLIILAGYALDLQRIVSSDIGFKGSFLLRMELPDPTPFELARMVATKLGQKGYVLGEGLTARYISDAIASMGEEWRIERNGRVADDLVHAIRMEVRKKAGGNDVGTLSPAMSSRMPIVMPDEITITVEDFQNAFRNGI